VAGTLVGQVRRVPAGGRRGPAPTARGLGEQEKLVDEAGEGVIDRPPELSALFLSARARRLWLGRVGR
jgi:hypothetical protein